MLVELLKPDFEIKSDRGILIQLVHDGWRQVNYITSTAGSVRGGHCHKYNAEVFYIIKGSFRLTVWNDQCEEEYKMKTGDMFMIKEHIYHTFEYDEDTSLISMYNYGVELNEGGKDIWKNDGRMEGQV